MHGGTAKPYAAHWASNAPQHVGDAHAAEELGVVGVGGGADVEPGVHHKARWGTDGAAVVIFCGHRSFFGEMSVLFVICLISLAWMSVRKNIVERKSFR